MKLNKKLVTLFAAGALTAATAIPAMAFENEFHGIYNLKFFMSNVENGSVKDIDPTLYFKENKTNNYFEQRARILYTAKASDDLKLVTHFELDTKFGGDKTGKYATSSDAGTFDADGISIETKWVYLDFNLGKSVKVKTGIQPIKDSVKGIFLDADATGVLVTSKLGDATVNTGYFRIGTETNTTAAGAATTIGHENIDVALLDAKYAVSKDLNVGLGYYLASNYANMTPTTIHMIDLNADAKVGPATISGFFAVETGVGTDKSGTSLKDSTASTKKKALSGYAANIAAKAPIGPGTLRTAFLFTSGDGNTTNGNNTAWATTGVVTYSEGSMLLLARTGVGGTTTDRTIIGTTGAGQKGVWLYTLGYDATITPKLYANANVGMAWAAKNLNAPGDKSRVGTAANGGTPNATNYIGTEISLETGYKIYDNLTAKLQAGYVILGGYYKGSAANTGVAADPENPYTVRTALSYAF